MRWTLKPDLNTEIVKHLQEVLGIDKVVAKLLVQRGITTYEEAKKFFRPSLDHLHDPFLMKDMDKAVSRILKAIERNERILVFGDYDVDGTTSVALVSSYLLTFYPHVDTYIPDRYAEGYGVSYIGIDYASDNEMTLIVALDCGIKSVDHVNYAKQKGIDFIICDHHLPGEEVPNAIAVLDPKQKDCFYPYKELCGCGVGFKLIQALGTTRNEGIESLIPYLDLVATAIGADIVPITGENRVLTHFGLKVLNSEPRPGIKALLSFYDAQEFTISDIVFKVAPKINAAGRIKHGKYAVDLLTKFTYEDGMRVAREITMINEERRTIDFGITEEALKMIEDENEVSHKSTVLFNPDWHKGVIGIVASRLIETYYRPTVVFTQSGDYLAASARSVKNFDIYQALESCEDYLIQFGGHMYAAGMTIKPENYVAFKQKFEEVVAATIEEKDLVPEIEIDDELAFEDITPRFLRILKQFEPFGPENMSPVFLTNDVYDTGFAKQVGKNQEHLRLTVKQRREGHKKFAAIGFNLGGFYSEITDKQRCTLVYSIEENNWKGNMTIQLSIKDMQSQR